MAPPAVDPAMPADYPRAPEGAPPPPPPGSRPVGAASPEPVEPVAPPVAAQPVAPQPSPPVAPQSVAPQPAPPVAPQPITPQPAPPVATQPAPVVSAPGAPIGSVAPETAVPAVRTGGLVVAGVVLFLLGLWAALAPFVGPTFGLSPDGTGSWTWNLGHVLLGLAPGGATMVAAVLVLIASREAAVDRGRALLRAGGVLAILSGAWLVVGPATWPVIETSPYFHGDAWGMMIRQIGHSFGPGLLVAIGGAYALGWAGRAAAGPRFVGPGRLASTGGGRHRSTMTAA